MKRVEDRLNQIFERLPPRKVVAESSPLQLTEFGRTISDDIDAKGIAQSLVASVMPNMHGKPAYDIQEFCFAHLNECELPEAQLNKIKQCAFDNGIEQENVRRVIAVELRNLILSELGLQLK